MVEGREDIRTSDMKDVIFEIFGLGYVIVAAGFYLALAKTAKPIPMPMWIWDQKSHAEVIELYQDVEKAA